MWYLEGGSRGAAALPSIKHDHQEETMRHKRFVIIATLLVLAAGVAGAADTRTYDRPLESTWDEAVKAARDAEMVVLDSDRSEHSFSMRTKAWYSHKKGRTMEVELSGDQFTATVTVRAADPDEATKLAKAIAQYMEALDKRMD
jgi:uncharacterized protein involved in exopolysaccharide biosynthesis